MMSSMPSTRLRGMRGAGTWHHEGKPRSYCGQRPCTTKEKGRAPSHCGSERVDERSSEASQNDGDQESERT